MPRPTTREKLSAQTAETFDDLIELIASVPPQQRTATFPFEHRDRNIRDVLGHLLVWQTMFFKWHELGQSGGVPEMPAPGYTWKTTPELNKRIWNDLQQLTYQQVSRRLKTSHRKLCELIEKYSERELFEKQFFGWTGSTSLASYIISAGPSHYRWASKLIRKATRLSPT